MSSDINMKEVTTSAAGFVVSDGCMQANLLRWSHNVLT